MTEISRLTGGNDAIELDFVEREATPIELMQLASSIFRRIIAFKYCFYS